MSESYTQVPADDPAGKKIRTILLTVGANDVHHDVPIISDPSGNLITPLKDDTFTGRIGEVQATPTANTVLARLKAIHDSLAGTLTATISGIVTVAGSVTANAGTNLNTSALALESGGNLAAIAGKDFSTETTLALIKAKTDNIDVALSTRTKPADTQTISGAVTISSGSVTANAGTNLNTSALALEAGGNLASIKTGTDKIPSQGQAAMAASTPVVIASNQSAVPVTLTSTTVTGTVAVTQSGTWDEVGINDSGNSITVDATSLPLPTGASTLAEQQTQTASLSVMDDWDETNRAAVNTIAGQVGVQGGSGTTNALTQRVVLATDVALPAGTNPIGKLLPSDVDVTTNSNHADKYYTSTGAVTDGIIWSPAAGKRWHVTTLYINVSAAATVTLEDDLAGGDVVRWKGELAANSGVIINYSAEHPFASGEDAADLIITTSAGNVYVQAVGFEV